VGSSAPKQNLTRGGAVWGPVLEIGRASGCVHVLKDLSDSLVRERTSLVGSHQQLSAISYNVTSKSE
jgi:hypothetical protein